MTSVQPKVVLNTISKYNNNTFIHKQNILNIYKLKQIVDLLLNLVGHRQLQWSTRRDVIYYSSLVFIRNITI